MTRASRSTQSPRRTRTARGLLAVVASIAMVLTGLAAVAPAARAVDNASISGVVTDADGPVAGVLVEAIQFVPVDGDEYGDPAETATRPITGADGTYTITGLAAGQYTLSFVDGGSVSYLGGATHPSTATRIMLGAGEAKTGVDDFLDERASVSGTVTSQADVALGGIEVRLLSVVENGGAIEEDLVSEVTTSGGGAYAFTGLLPGEYTLRFHDPAGTYPDQYLGETAALQDAERFTLETGDAEVVDAALLDEDGFRDYRSGPLGSVVDAEGDPLEGATVTLYRAATTAGPFVQVAGGSIDLSPTGRVNPLSTGVDGGFGWSVLAGAVYEVRATKAGCVSALDTAAPFATSGAVEVGELDTELELALLCTAGFAGTVSSAAAAPLDGIVVEALALEEVGGVFQATVVDDTETEDGGGFDFDGLPPGDYTLRFSDPIGGTYPQQYLGGTTDLQNADRFSLVVGVTPDDIAATLLDADALRTYLGGPSGTVTAPGGAAVDGATVTLYRSASPSGPFVVGRERQRRPVPDGPGEPGADRGRRHLRLVGRHGLLRGAGHQGWLRGHGLARPRVCDLRHHLARGARDPARAAADVHGGAGEGHDRHHARALQRQAPLRDVEHRDDRGVGLGHGDRRAQGRSHDDRSRDARGGQGADHAEQEARGAQAHADRQLPRERQPHGVAVVGEGPDRHEGEGAREAQGEDRQARDPGEDQGLRRRRQGAR